MAKEPPNSLTHQLRTLRSRQRTNLNTSVRLGTLLRRPRASGPREGENRARLPLGQGVRDDGDAGEFAAEAGAVVSRREEELGGWGRVDVFGFQGEAGGVEGGDADGGYAGGGGGAGGWGCGGDGEEGEEWGEDLFLGGEVVRI